MGWRDINMNRKKPPLRLAVVPVEAGQDRHQAVLRKTCAAAAECFERQLTAGEHPQLAPFFAGYLAGYARHQALKHAVDVEQGEMQSFLHELSRKAPASVAAAILALRFLTRAQGSLASRASLRADAPLADAGYLVGHLASLSGSERLLKAASDLGWAHNAADAFLTACDGAADPMQTRHPTLSLRFDDAERAIIMQAFPGA